VEYDVADLPAGIYLLQINNGKENGFAKFVKQ
ncbi:MAG: T9SS type A sorting domain-containing protein, partial [Saprospiraceae bacterium]